MGLDVKGVGIIAVVCGECGAKLYWYAIGDKGNKSKFSGPPTPSKALSGFDGVECPICESKLSLKPRKYAILSRREFEDIYSVGGYKLIFKVSSLEEHIGVMGAVKDGSNDLAEASL